jgi:ABC-type glucose/galactose transport system permease subunit
MAKSLHNYTVAEAQNVALGQAGSILIDDTAGHTGKFVALTALSTSVLDVSEMSNITNTIEDADADISIPTGVTIYGEFEDVQLASGGPLLAYKG